MFCGGSFGAFLYGASITADEDGDHKGFASVTWPSIQRGPSPKSWWPKATVSQASGSAGGEQQDNPVKNEAGQSKKKSRKTKQAPVDQGQSASHSDDQELLSWGNSWLSTEFWKTGDQKDKISSATYAANGRMGSTCCLAST